MKAIICTKYGAPEVLVENQVAKPIPKANEVLIKIHATSVTASDVHIRAITSQKSFLARNILQAVFGYGKPRNPILGMTLSGEVECTGKTVTSFQQGDKVFAYGSVSPMNRRFGSYAEYICLPENWNLLHKPTNVTHEQAAAIPYGGFLAMHCLNKGKIQKGQEVLIYGASGSIGTMAVQLAKAADTTVTAVCSGKNVDLVKSLGADHTIDYTKSNAVSHLEKYHFVFDAVGNSKTSPLKSALPASLAKTGKYVSIDDEVPMTKREDFIKMKELVEKGKLKAVIDRSYPLRDIVQAHAYVDQGHKRGNIVISVSDKADQR